MYTKLASRMTLVFILFFTSLAIPSTGEASTSIKVEIDGEIIKFDQPATTIAGRTMVPMRKIFEELDSTVHWDAKTQTITASRGSKKITLKIGSKTATVNGQRLTLDVTPQVVKGRTLVPLRFISEALGAKVDWNSQTKTVSIVTFEYIERYYYVDRVTLNISEHISEERFYEDFYRIHQTRELVADTIFTSFLDNASYFESDHTSMVFNGDKFDAQMIIEGTVIDGKASGSYVIDLYDLKIGRRARTYNGTFKDVPYNRNLKISIQRLLDSNHSVIR
ncbi:hypothetical protein DS745_09195 [Anaerobacillus alkaliphilus]|uniref:Copper amine oxidase-like N-terminal domain-containing protein n=1 Tax=Anaerobacillus alkaliphilus TaxID=1548597 RepID=A0A4Q0VSX4_9BACI|nr:stalk domain-containing protein [Anaerobacillus alkaliphilus]RXJ01646.1 hypothetical protein DS745_09195 [Anaerobacillus alkaliphilus]